MSERDLVVLVHGLTRTRFSLRRMERALRAAGYDTVNRSYPSRRHSVAELIGLLRGELAALEPRGGRVHFVGHSLGALLIRAALQPAPPFALGRIVLVAPPNRGAGIVSRLARWPLLLRAFGRPSMELAQDAPWLARLPVVSVETGVLVGARQWHPLNPSSWANLALGAAGPHDGTVEHESSRLPGMRDFAVVDASHTFICDHPEAIRQTLNFLRNGRFAPY